MVSAASSIDPSIHSAAADMNPLGALLARLWRYFKRASPWVAGLLTAAVVYLLWIDVTPPFERIDYVCRDATPQQPAIVDTPENPCSRIIPPVVAMSKSGKREYVQVRYITTKPRTWHMCPGQVQQEYYGPDGFRDSQTEWRAAVPVEWQDHPTDPKKAILIGNPVPVPRSLDPGKIKFKSVTFRYCNFLQEWLHRPIVRSGPDLEFTLVVTDGDGGKR